MIIAICCFSCGKEMAILCEPYLELVDQYSAEDEESPNPEPGSAERWVRKPSLCADECSE